MGDLFGSDEEGEGEDADGGPAVEAPSAEPVDFALPTQPRPPDDAKLYLCRLPNILKFQPRPFNSDDFDDEEVMDILTSPSFYHLP